MIIDTTTTDKSRAVVWKKLGPVQTSFSKDICLADLLPLHGEGPREGATNVAVEATKICNDLVDKIIRSAHDNDIAVSDISLRAFNILDAEKNPDGLIMTFRVSAIGVRRSDGLEDPQ
jgi:hypothetical protein